MSDKAMILGNETNNVDLIINGIVQSKQLKIPNSSNSTIFGLGSAGQVIKSNGTTIYWGNETGITTVASQSQNGLMSFQDKIKLDGLLDVYPSGEINIDFNGSTNGTTNQYYLDRIIVGTIAYNSHISATDITL